MLDETFNLHGAFYGKQSALRCLLETGREIATHAGAKGDGSELRWKEMLSAFLPQRYLVSKGFVVDSAGQRSVKLYWKFPAPSGAVSTSCTMNLPLIPRME